MATKLDELFLELRARDTGLQASLSGVEKRLDSLDKVQARSLGNLDPSLQRVRTSVLSMAAVWAGWRVGRGIVEAGMQVEAIRNRMVAATGDSRIAAESLAYVREEANRLGVDVRTAADGFSGFAASALRAGLTFQQTKDIFTGVSEAAVSMHLPAEQVALVFKALEQIAGKGTVSMEELRGQLGDALPGAFEIAAKSMGKTTAEFAKMVANGEVMSSEFLPKFGASVRKELGGSVEEASKSAQAGFARMGNAFFELQSKMAESGFLDAVTHSVEELTAAMNDPETIAGLKGFASLMGDIITASTKAASAIGSVYAWQKERRDAVNSPRWDGYSDLPSIGVMTDDARHTKSLRERVLADFAAKQAAAATERGPAENPSAGYTLGKASAPGESSAARAAREKAERMKQQLADKADAMRYGFADPEDQATMDVEREQKILREALEAKAITEQEFRDLSLMSEMAYQDQLKEIREKAWEEEQSAFEGFLGIRLRSLQQMREMTIADQAKGFRDTISQAAQHNRFFFALEKAAALARATIAAYESVVTAYAFGSRIGGPPLGAVFAGVAAAAQAVNISQLASASFNGGGSVTSSGGGGGGGEELSSGSGGSVGASSEPSKMTTIVLKGMDFAMLPMNQVRELVDRFNEAGRDGARVEVRYS